MKIALTLIVVMLSGFGSGNAGNVLREAGKPAMNVLDDDRLRLLFSNSIVTSDRISDVKTDHPRGELFRSNGTYRRSLGRAGYEGTFTIQDDMLCVSGPEIRPLCRRVVSQGDGTYLMIDVSDHSQIVVRISQLD